MVSRSAVLDARLSGACFRDVTWKSYGAGIRTGRVKQLGATFRTDSVRAKNVILVQKAKPLNLAEREGFELGGGIREIINLLIFNQLLSPAIPSTPRIWQ